MDGFGGVGVLRIAEVEQPEPGPGQVLIRVAASSVNRPDLIQREGRYPPPPGESAILGLECAGTVAAVGQDVDMPAVGDRVLALLGGGGYAEFAVAHAAHSLPIPASLGFDAAACIAETWITAWLNLFEIADLRDGESVIVHGGSGGVGTAAIQLVRALCPASPIIVTVSAGKIERVLQLGADRAIDYRSENFSNAIRDATGGNGADVILDHIGGDSLERNLRALAVGGRLVVIGITSGADALLNLGRLMLKRQRIIGSVLRSRPVTEKAAIIGRFAARVLPLLAEGRIGPVIDSRYPLAAVADAHRRMEAGAHFGKIVLIVDEGAC
jgi:putative PIG3 family NAD(P)H quinone oxidoreductase